VSRGKKIGRQVMEKKYMERREVVGYRSRDPGFDFWSYQIF
jgi:hypothetical protein